MINSFSFPIEKSIAVQLRALNYVELKSSTKAVEIGMQCDELVYENIGKRNVIQTKLKQAIANADAINSDVVTLNYVTKEELMVMLIDAEIELAKLMQRYNKDFDSSVIEDVLHLRAVVHVLNGKHKEFFAKPLTETEMNS